ncbi:MAG: pyrroline-5-carboxylate reductase [Verrucomicrobiota bacterium]|nr:pyrroline-5-carboxylate reductase [Verrucomicrobiota bacterium]
MGFLGAGKMGEAMIAALIRAGAVRPGDVLASDVSPARRRHLAMKYRVRVGAENPLVARSARALFLAVKPQDLERVLAEIAPAMSRKRLVISIAAGRTTAWIEKRLPQARVIRVMPNLACAVGEGMSVCCLGRRAAPADARTVRRLLACFGRVLRLPERLFDAVTALSGSGPAFFAYVLDRMADAATREGIRRADALLLAEQTMLGAAKALLEGGADPLDFIRAVASPKGATAAGLAVLDASPIGDILGRAIRAAARRSKELARG